MLELNILLKLSIIILVGIIGGRLANLFKMPKVSGYIIAGLIIGPSFMNLIMNGDIGNLSIINEIALSAIAFGIGSEFLLKDIKKIGKKIFIITLGEVIGAFLVVFITMYFLFNMSIEFSMIIASMSAATAPAGIVMVIRELKAKGPLTNTILPVVAIDDALGIMLFGICLSIAKVLNTGEGYSLIQIIKEPIIEIIGSLILGALVGFIMTYVINKAKNKEESLSISIGFILFGAGISSYLSLSSLLTCMMIGGTLVNLKPNSSRVFNGINEFTPPINILFFTLAGISLDIDALKGVGLLGLAYILARGLGKIIGARIGSTITGVEDTIVKYLGMSLLTQGGISIGLSMIVKKELPDLSNGIVTLILFSVLIYEILGPILAKIGLTKAGEANINKKEIRLSEDMI